MHGGLASSTDPATWGTYEEAAAAAQRYDGVGFVINNVVVLIDLDGSRDAATGTIEPWAQNIVDFLQCPHRDFTFRRRPAHLRQIIERARLEAHVQYQR